MKRDIGAKWHKFLLEKIRVDLTRKTIPGTQFIYKFSEKTLKSLCPIIPTASEYYVINIQITTPTDFRQQCSSVPLRA